MGTVGRATIVSLEHENLFNIHIWLSDCCNHTKSVHAFKYLSSIPPLGHGYLYQCWKE